MSTLPLGLILEQLDQEVPCCCKSLNWRVPF